ncbi:MAG: AEC family transporter [Oscillospiraceae bacterium]|jgi:predicted permease|nr:AEC family transporter [Oscillospiraceae bacterium]
MMFYNALAAVATMLILMGLGFLFAWKGYLTSDGDGLLSALVVRAALPGSILATMLNTFTRARLADAAALLLVPIPNMLLWILAARPLARLFRVPEKRRGVFAALLAFSNTVFIGFPVVRAVIGEIGIPYATVYYLANTVVFWVFGSGLIQRDADASAAPSFNISAALKRLAIPPFITLIISIVLVVLGVSLPAPVMDAAQSVGGLVTPLSMVFIGSMLYRVTRSGLKWERGFGAVIAARYIAAPALTVLTGLALGVSGLPAQVFALQSGMASMTQIAIIAHDYGADSEYASLGIAISTLSLMAALPLFALILPLL